MKLLQIIGQNVKVFRTIRQLTQEELGKKAGLHKAYIGFIERGERNLSMETLEIIAGALKVPPHILLQPDIKEWVR